MAFSVSANMVSSSSDRSFWCEMLTSDKYFSSESFQADSTKLIINDVYVVEPRFHEVPRDLYQGFVTSQSAHKLLLCT